MAVLAAAPLIAAAAAFGSHVPGASYTGTTSGGGSVGLQLSADGNAVTRLEVDPGFTECGFHPLVVNQIPGIPIVDHAFTYSSPPWTVSGSFPAPQSAQGTMAYRRETAPACTMSQRSWTATVATPTPTASATPVATATPTPTPVTGGLRTTVVGPRVALQGRTIVVRVGSNRPASAQVTGRVTVRETGGRTKRFTLRRISTRLKGGGTTRLRLTVSGSGRTAIKRALRSRRIVRASIRITARDAAENFSTTNWTGPVSG